jgi:hypothetical protein
MHAHADATNTYAGASDEEHSVLEDDSDGDERDAEYMDEEDDRSSSLSIPNESIDFDLVYSLHSFAATVEGQASVVKGDSLFLMDDSNSYWWLVRVLKTQDVGYIPAENIETPFERLARLNKHRNVDVSLEPSNTYSVIIFLHSSPTQLHKNCRKTLNVCGITFLLALARTIPPPQHLVFLPHLLDRAKVSHSQLPALSTVTRLQFGVRKMKMKMTWSGTTAHMRKRTQILPKKCWFVNAKAKCIMTSSTIR